MKAVVLLSGGLDSTVCMAVANSQGYELYPISFNYNQRHDRELQSASSIATFYKATRHIVINTNMDMIGGSALTDNGWLCLSARVIIMIFQLHMFQLEI